MGWLAALVYNACGDLAEQLSPSHAGMFISTLRSTFLNRPGNIYSTPNTLIVYTFDEQRVLEGYMINSTPRNIGFLGTEIENSSYPSLRPTPAPDRDISFLSRQSGKPALCPTHPALCNRTWLWIASNRSHEMYAGKRSFRSISHSSGNLTVRPPLRLPGFCRRRLVVRCPPITADAGPSLSWHPNCHRAHQERRLHYPQVFLSHSHAVRNNLLSSSQIRRVSRVPRLKLSDRTTPALTVRHE